MSCLGSHRVRAMLWDGGYGKTLLPRGLQGSLVPAGSQISGPGMGLNSVSPVAVVRTASFWVSVPSLPWPGERSTARGQGTAFAPPQRKRWSAALGWLAVKWRWLAVK